MSERTSSSQQECSNIPGGSTCSCVYGYTLNADQKTCDRGKCERERAALSRNVAIHYKGPPAPVSMAILSMQIKKTCNRGKCQRERAALSRNVAIYQEDPPAPVSMAILSTQIRKYVAGVTGSAVVLRDDVLLS